MPRPAPTGSAGDRLSWYSSGNSPRQDNWTSHQITSGLGGPTSTRPYGMDGDGDLDARVALHDARAGLWYEQPTDPVNQSWTSHTISNAVPFATELVRDDLDNDAEEILERLEEELAGRPNRFLLLALIHASLGSTEQALALSAEAIERRSVLGHWLPIVPSFFAPALGEEPEFQRLLHRMKSPA